MTSSTMNDLLARMATDPTLARDVQGLSVGELSDRYRLTGEEAELVATIRMDRTSSGPARLEERLSRSGLVFGTELVGDVSLATADFDTDDSGDGDSGDGDSGDGDSGDGDSSGESDGGDRSEKSDGGDRAERSEKPEKSDDGDEPEKSHRSEKSDDGDGKSPRSGSAGAEDRAAARPPVDAPDPDSEPRSLRMSAEKLRHVELDTAAPEPEPASEPRLPGLADRLNSVDLRPPDPTPAGPDARLTVADRLVLPDSVSADPDPKPTDVAPAEPRHTDPDPTPEPEPEPERKPESTVPRPERLSAERVTIARDDLDQPPASDTDTPVRMLPKAADAVMRADAATPTSETAPVLPPPRPADLPSVRLADAPQLRVGPAGVTPAPAGADAAAQAQVSGDVLKRASSLGEQVAQPAGPENAVDYGGFVGPSSEAPASGGGFSGWGGGYGVPSTGGSPQGWTGYGGESATFGGWGDGYGVPSAEDQGAAKGWMGYGGTPTDDDATKPDPRVPGATPPPPPDDDDGIFDTIGGALEDAGKWGVGAVEDAANWGAGAAEDTVDAIGGAAEDTAGAIVDVGTSAIDRAGDGAAWVKDQVGTGVERLSEPILGKETARDFGNLVADAGTIAVTGGTSAVTSVGMAAAANAAGDAVEGAAKDLGVSPEAAKTLGDAAGIGTGVGLGGDAITAAGNRGINPGAVAGDLASSATTGLLGADGGAAVGRFAETATNNYGDDIARQRADGRLSAYDDRPVDLVDPRPAGAPMMPGYTETPEQRDQLEAAGREAFSETIEATYEPIIGQKAAEDLGAAADDIVIEAVKTVATGGASAAKVGVTAGLAGFEAATGTSLPDTVGKGAADALEPLIGKDASDTVGSFVSKGVKGGIDVATSGGDVPDVDPEDVLDAVAPTLTGKLSDLTGIDRGTLDDVLHDARTGDLDPGRLGGDALGSPLGDLVGDRPSLVGVLGRVGLDVPDLPQSPEGSDDESADSPPDED
jgi:hypothetical protein